MQEIKKAIRIGGHKDTLNIQYKKIECIRVDNVNSSIPGIQLIFEVKVSFCHTEGLGTPSLDARWFSE